MDTYRTEEEQLEAIKRWWQENGKFTVIGVALALAAVFGWHGWNAHQVERAGDASLIYDNLLQTDQLIERDPTKRATAEHLATTLKDGFSAHSYAHYAALILAKYAVKDGDYAAAETELQWVLDQQPEPAVKAQTQLRLARLEYAQQNYDAALTALQPLLDGAAAVQALELRGDVLQKQGDFPEALAAYQQAKAVNAQQQSPLNSPLLEMKINSLSAIHAAAEE